MIQGMIVLGAAIGILLCYMVKKKERYFRQKLFSECEAQLQKGNVEKYLATVMEHKEKWLRTIALVRKPFNRQMNLAIEAMALVIALLALVNAVTNFEKIFTSAVQGEATIAFLSMVLAFIPNEWMLTNVIQKDLTAVLRELMEAQKNNRLKAYLDAAKTSP